MNRFRKNGRHCLTTFVLFALCLAGVPAQSGRNKPPPPNEKPPKRCKEDKQNPPSPLTVLLNVLVTDAQGRPVADVAKDDFRIAENEVPQQISVVSKRETPLSNGLLVDCSGSLRTQFNTVADAAKALIDTNAPDDAMFLTSFVSRDKIKLRQDWTSNRTLLRKQVDELFVESGPSAVIDAVYESALYLSQRLSLSSKPRRSALIVITDGEDRESFYKREQLMKLLGEQKIQVFVIGFTRQLENNSHRERIIDFILSLTQETGGRAFFPTTPTELAQAVKYSARVIGAVPDQLRAS